MLVKHTNEDETKIIFIDDFTYKATHIFNANAFPDSLKGEIGACVTRMRIFQHSVREVCVQISKDYEVFHNILDENIDDLTESAISRPDLSLVCLNDNVNYISSMCSSLIFLKSFLDIYSKVIVHSIKPGQSMQFDKSVVNAGEEKISGGKLIKWLRNSAPTQYQELSDIIFRNSVDWISLAIKYRVVLVHKGDLPELYGMRVPLRPKSPPFTARDIEPPKMPHGEDVRDYVRSLANKLHDFLEITLPYIPNVKIELVDFRKFSSDTV